MSDREPETPAEKLRAQLARVEIGAVDLSGLRPPPEDGTIRLALSGGGGVVLAAGAILSLLALPTLVGAFLCVGIGVASYGAVMLLYGQWDGPLAARPTPRPPASGKEGIRSTWETAMTVAVVLAVANLPFLLLATGLTAMFLHWVPALLLALGGNAGLAGLAYLGDGKNRRPLPPEGS